MKTTFRFLGLDAQPTWRRLVEQELTGLQSLSPITAAEVVLERQPGVPPVFRVRVALEVSGWDFHAETTDPIRQAALLKAIQNLEHQIRARKSTRLPQREAPPHFSPISSL